MNPVVKKGMKKMKKLVIKPRKKVGSPPGTLLHTGEKKMEQVRFRAIDFEENRIEEHEFDKVEDLFPYRDTDSVSWLNIDGLHDLDVIEKFGKHFNIHSLVLEDILDTRQRPKAEDYDNYIYVTLRMFYYLNENEAGISSEQISLILGKNFVITFQEKAGDVFEGIRERLRAGKGKIRTNGADYLAYTLIDAITDSYFYILENLGEEIEILEDELINDPIPDSLQKIHKLRREVIYMRRAVWPMREVINSLYRKEFNLVTENTELYLRDVYDHTIQVIDTIESLRDVLSGMLDTYLSSVSNKMNDVMKVLTIIATIFIPLTFLAGVYGMNFRHMPELGWGWIYPDGFWIAISIIAGGMIFYFKRKGWF